MTVNILGSTICPLACSLLSSPHTRNETTQWHSLHCHKQSSHQRRHAGNSSTLARCGPLVVELLMPYLQKTQQNIIKHCSSYLVLCWSSLDLQNGSCQRKTAFLGKLRCMPCNNQDAKAFANKAEPGLTAGPASLYRLVGRQTEEKRKMTMKPKGNQQFWQQHWTLTYICESNSTRLCAKTPPASASAGITAAEDPAFFRLFFFTVSGKFASRAAAAAFESSSCNIGEYHEHYAQLQICADQIR